jgi:hypothetical protein
VLATARSPGGELDEQHPPAAEAPAAEKPVAAEPIPVEEAAALVEELVTDEEE